MTNQSIYHPEILYDKSFQCPICHTPFTSKAIKLNMNRVVSVDRDLCIHYDLANPLIYEIISCPNCGYSASHKTFDKILPTQVTWIKEHFTSNYKKRIFNNLPSIQEAIIKHQLALTCSIIKKGKTGEQAYLALHTAWLYRELHDVKKEELFLSRSMDGFIKALESENFPIVNLDENTTLYIISAISYQLKQFNISKKYLAEVIRSSSGQLKERALDLKALLNT